MDDDEALSEIRRLGGSGDVRMGGGFGTGSAPRRMISGRELSGSQYVSQCFACSHINSKSLRENPTFMTMMRLYVDNSSSVARDGLYTLIRRYYDDHIRSHVDGSPAWTIECITEHFAEHTRYPTDEILAQLEVARGIRREIQDSLVSIQVSDRVKVFDERNIKLLLSVNNEIRTLLRQKRDISTMVGYCEVLNY